MYFISVVTHFYILPKLACCLRDEPRAKNNKFTLSLYFSLYIQFVLRCTRILFFKRQTKCHTGMLVCHLETECLHIVETEDDIIWAKVITKSLVQYVLRHPQGNGIHHHGI